MSNSPHGLNQSIVQKKSAGRRCNAGLEVDTEEASARNDIESVELASSTAKSKALFLSIPHISTEMSSWQNRTQAHKNNQWPHERTFTRE